LKKVLKNSQKNFHEKIQPHDRTLKIPKILHFFLQKFSEKLFEKISEKSPKKISKSYSQISQKNLENSPAQFSEQIPKISFFSPKTP